MNNDASVQALKEFLLKIDSLRELKKTSFNVFDVLKISRTEIRHSNVLAWLLDPNGNHGYSHEFIALLNFSLVRAGFVSPKDEFKLLTMKYSDVVVLREWQNIDTQGFITEPRTVGRIPLCLVLPALPILTVSWSTLPI